MMDFLDDLIQYTLLHHRWILVVFFLLPISITYEFFLYARNWISFKLNVAPLQHEKRVKYVQQQVKEWRSNHSDKQMCTARPGWHAMSFRKGKYKATMFNVDVNLHDILEINVDHKYVRVEPMVSMGQLTGALNPLGWTIPILPELEDLTVGGLINGTGVESSSHIYGLFQHICRAFEIVLCDGSVVRCSREENSDLFYAVPSSHGTLGFLVSAEIDIVRARDLVKLHYKPVRTLQEACETFRTAYDDKSNDFIEMLMFDLNTGVLMTGVMVDGDESTKVNAIGRWHKPWFFKHVQGKLEKNLPAEALVEYVPLRDYYHRHSRSIFWEIQDIVPFSNNIVFRWLLGWAMPPKISLLKLTQNKSITRLYETKHVIQDMLLPARKLEQCLAKVDELVKIYPLWVCPFNLTPEPFLMRSEGQSDEMFVDVGIYGVPKTEDYEAVKTTREIEKFLIDVGGYQMLYADTYTTKEEFRKMFDHTHYDKVRTKLDCESAFPEIYDKVSKKARI